ncbi:2-oxoglutarate dehydrogenase complex dihydrolipoyllysine-residue succinyltransferase [Pelagibacteraceae bacterium]|nr:2-oxoglutarate dehydrogenase complex dihydrolipoyllysine-residue succinyltransferase [Pelagibacteraceae bacterium]MDC0339517.1 2-oxoglutarate dehydrogenase complex dihydrolipoyllysine-residue succinyltransferase [Pelagibacteraceae bacterium]MDC0366115.1 2-oxoglutarate dehydrogenase complex dihydrolipoyllysine-residue succinyltransferase [Pelagibacteraceae bacterium]|tara:strand:+ start:1042 stop:2352 length:1311 start_codon:yes stop_codon:yes gene_type:complete
MSDKIIVPTLGESITEATVSKWLKNQGETVSADEPVVELETDKVNVEVPAPSNGVLENISVKEGETVNVGALLGVINGSTKNISDKVKEVKDYSPPKKQEQILKEPEKNPQVFKDEEKPLKLEEEPLILNDLHEEKKDLGQEKEKVQKQEKTFTFSPAAKKMAAEAKIDLDKVKGSGKHGVILKEDIMSLMGSKPPPSERKIKHGPEERIKMTRLRLTIARRLKEAQENAAMLTTFNEVDMSEVISMRNQHKEDFQNKYGVKLGFMSFFAKSCVIGLKNFPSINAEIQGDEIVYKNYYNISIAVGTDRGLVVPVLRETDEMSFADIEKTIGELGEKARGGKITIDDLQGGTFTITNGGIYGSMLSTPILNPPQSAVLGMHNIVQRPVVVDGNVEVRPIMYLALSYDHRIIDGKEAVSFLKIVKDSLEQPKRLFLNI